MKDDDGGSRRRRPGGWRPPTGLPGTIPKTTEHQTSEFPDPVGPPSFHKGGAHQSGDIHGKPQRELPTQWAPPDQLGLGGGEGDGTADLDEVFAWLEKQGLIVQLATADRARVLSVSDMHGFLSALPPMSLTPWARTQGIQGSTVPFVAGDGTFDVVLEMVPTKQTRIVQFFSWSWLFRGLDPLNLHAYAPTNDYYNSYGRLAVNLAVNGSSLFNVRETLYDSGAPAPGITNVAGFTLLNRNILEQGGASPTVVYIPENTRLQARLAFYPGTLAPGLQTAPDQFRMEVRGWAVPKPAWYFLRQLRAT